MEDLEFFEQFKDLMEIQRDIITEHDSRINQLNERIDNLEDMCIKLSRIIVDLKAENEQLALGYNSFMGK